MTGMKHAEIARQFRGISVSMISRHGRKCLGISATGALAATDGDSLQEKCSLWLQRADSLYVASGAALDLRGQRDAIAAAFRALEFRFKHEERLAEKELRDLPSDPNHWTEDEGVRMRSYLDKTISDASKTGYASPDVKWLNLKVALEKRPELWDLCVVLAHSPEVQQRAQVLLLEKCDALP
jgi:hypothetical protein